MKDRLIIEGNAVYEIDEACMQKMKKEQKKQMEEMQRQKEKKSISSKNR